MIALARRLGALLLAAWASTAIAQAPSVITIENRERQAIVAVEIGDGREGPTRRTIALPNPIMPGEAQDLAVGEPALGCNVELYVRLEDGSGTVIPEHDRCVQPRLVIGPARDGPRDEVVTAAVEPAPTLAPPPPPPPPPPAPRVERPGGGSGSGLVRAVRPARPLPQFPWPAPKPVKQIAVPVAAVGGPNATLDQVLARLERGIARASPGYETGVFGGPPNGFVLLTRMERIQATGAPFPGANRFTLKGNPRAGFWDMLESLMGERPGYFRVIAFVVANDLAIDPDRPASSVPNVRDGAARLPPGLGRQRLGDRRVFALVYAYERRDGERQRPWIEGAPSALQHLRASGIGPSLGL